MSTESDQLNANSLNGPRVVVLAYNQLCTFEFGIAVEIFGLPRPEFGENWYQFEVASAEGPRLSADGGISVNVEKDLSVLPEADIIVLPGWRAPYADVPNQLIEALKRAHAQGSRIVAICGGAYILAATGLLTGRRATTHWRFLSNFIEAYPEVDLEEAPLFCEDENLYTSAGSAAGIDLCLHVVGKDYGLEIANEVARRLVVAPLRSGQQSQMAVRPVLPQNKNTRLTNALETFKADLAARHTIHDAAAIAGMSPRTFVRQFENITGSPFGEWIGMHRLERAKTLLRETDLSVELVSEACGYASSSSLRRLFSAVVKVSPLKYRKNHSA